MVSGEVLLDGRCVGRLLTKPATDRLAGGGIGPVKERDWKILVEAGLLLRIR